MFSEFALLTPEEEQSFVQQTTQSLVSVILMQQQYKPSQSLKRPMVFVQEPLNKRRKTTHKDMAEKKANFLDGKYHEFVVQHEEYMQDDTEYHPDCDEIVEEVRRPMDVIVETKNAPKPKSKARKQEHKGIRRSENQSRIFCNHCKTHFFAKPTLRKKKHVFALNHACKPGEKRRQYVLGKKHRKCEFTHDGPCLQLSPEWQINKEATPSTCTVANAVAS